MIVHSPLPERPRSLDEAIDRGFDPHAGPDMPVEPLPADDPWMVALAESVEIVRALREQEATR